MPRAQTPRRVIRIVPYDPAWSNQFAALARALRQALGNAALRIDHIGSTSVAGLAAKDVIDIQVTVASLDPAVRSALNAMGYVHRPHLADHVPPGAEGAPENWAKWVFVEPTGQRATNVHVRVAGRPNQQYPLLFRDFLRSNNNAMVAYERVKTALARLHPQDMDAYTAVKDPVCDIVLEAAKAWALSTRWVPGSSDA